MSIAFLLTSLLVCVTPGTGVIYTLSAALAEGRRSSLVAAFGCALGTLPHLIAAVAGVAAVLYAYQPAFEAVKLAGVAYLLYLAWATWRDRSRPAVPDAAAGAGAERVRAPRPAGQIVVRAVLINLLNPKLTLFAFAFLPQFVPAGAPGTLPRMLGLAAVFVLMTFAVFAGYGIAAAAVRRHVIGRPRVIVWMRRCFAASFVVLAARLAVQRAS